MTLTRRLSIPWRTSSCSLRASSGARISASAARPVIVETLRARLACAWRASEASPMPNADSTPDSGWSSTDLMPSASATRQACCPPAPPNEFITYSADVVAALHRDGLDRVRHVLDGDLDEAVGDLFRRAPVAELAGQRLERLAHRRPVERLVLPGPEDVRKEIGLELSRHDIGVGDGERAAAPVGEGARIGARRNRARPGTAPRRNAGSSRRPRPRYGSASSARARGRPPPRSRSCARKRRHSGRHRSRCRPCRSR